MPQTPDQVLAERIARLKASLIDANLSDKRIIFQELAIAQQAAMSSAVPGSGTSDVALGVDASADINSIIFLLSQLVDETINSKGIAEVLLQDESVPPRYFVVQSIVDNTTGLVTPLIKNPDGSAFTVAPTGELSPVRDLKLQENRYVAKNPGTGFLAGHSIVNIRLIDDAANIKAFTWYNISLGAVIPGIPNILDLMGYEDRVEELLTSILTALPTGVATALKQEEEILALEAIGTNTGLAAKEATLLDARNILQAIEQNTVTANTRPLSALIDSITINAPYLATADNQADELAILTDIKLSLGAKASEAIQLVVRDMLAAIQQNTLVPNTRPLTATTDSVSVNAPTLATKINQDAANTALAAIQASSALSATAALQGTVIAALNQILIELSKQKEFEDLIVQDTAGTAFIRREVLNESTNQRIIEIENFDGTVGIPVGAVTTVKQIRGNNILSRNYYAKAAGPGFALGDSLSTLQVVNGETNVVTMLGWFNIAQQTSIAAPPTTAIEGYEDLIQELLATIVSVLPASLGIKVSAESFPVTLATDTILPLPIGAATDAEIIRLTEALGVLLDISIPPDETADATVKGLIRLMSKRIANASADELAAIGAALETDLIGSPGDFGSLKAVVRGQWYDLQNILGSTGDTTTGGIFDAGSVKMLLRSLGRLLIDGEQLTGLYDQSTGQRASILPPTARATDEPALVVAISPHTPITIDQLPPSIQADLSAIRANTARISQYGFNLAQTTAGLVFLVRTDGVTGATVNINLQTQLPFAPGSIEMNDPVVAPTNAGTKVIEPNEFVAKTTVPGRWAVDDILTRVVVVDTSNNTISGTIWQDAAGNLLSQIPVLGVDVEDTNRTQLALLKAQPTAGTPITGATLPTGSGIYGWLSWIRQTVESLIPSLSSIDLKLPTVGQKTSALSSPVVIASDNALTIGTLPATAATTAGQTAANGFLSTLIGRTPTLGQKTGVNSSPVVLASDTPVPALITDGAINAAIKPSNIPSGITDNALVVALRPDSNVVVSGLPGSIQADIAAIKANTARISQYQFQLVEDATGTVFVARWDTVTGVTLNLTLGGSIYTPSGALDVVASGGGGGGTLSLEINEYEASTTNGANWTINDVLTRILIVNTTTNAVASTIWQSASGATLTTIPVIGVDCIDTDKRQLALLKSIDTKSPTLGSAATALSMPVNIATDQIVPVALADRHIVGATFAHAAGVNILAAVAGTFTAIDLSGYRSFNIQVVSSLSIANQWILEGSNDNVNFVPAPCVDQANPNVTILGSNVSYSAFPVVYIGRRTYRYLRMRNISTLAGGTVTAITTLSPFDIVLPTSVGITPGTVVGSQLAGALNVIDFTLALSSSPSGTNFTAPFSPTWGTAISFAYSIILSNAGSNVAVSVQELGANGWTDLHNWPILVAATANASFADTSPVFAVTARLYRFAYTSTASAGGTWNLTLSHNQLNISPATPLDSRIDTQLYMQATASDALNVQGKGVASFTLSGSTWSGVAQVQVTGDGITWSSLNINNAVYSPAAKSFINNGNINVNGIYEINCAGFKAVRLASNSGGTGIATVAIRASNASSIVAIEGQISAQISNTNLLTRSDSVSNSTDLNGTIAASASSTIFQQTWGVSRAAEINITAISAGTTYICEWQEPVGTGWRTVYRFEATSNTGVRRSPLLPNINSNWRYLETIIGATPSVTRSITRTQSNLPVDPTLNTTQIGGFNFSDLAVAGRTRAITANNNSAVKLYLQVHDKATGLATGDTPINGRVYPIAPGGVVALGVGDLGPNGTQLGVSTRLALSTAFSTWVSPAAVGTPNQTFSLHAEVV
jgi:hypothetical protein